MNDEHSTSLERFGVFLNRQPEAFTDAQAILSETAITELFSEIQTLTGASTDAVAASVYMRRHGFFLTGLFHMLSKFNLLYTGKLEDVSLFIENGTIRFSIQADSFEDVHDRHEAIQHILAQYGHPVVESISKRAHVSKLILWENVWGYVIWMYSMLLTEECPSAQSDLDFLLEDETWKPHMRRSPFKQYLQNEEPLEAMTNYKRTTCCLLKELPNTEKCPYCPLNRT
ncbi:IucA/IucC family C-terminal-domain containing protein [Sporosarcina highlanderae]|uniref:IucA/IucC family C-terminal-domain containing protein n=1 Tax=Sporosarcina highlanderae TaxID=3035916 RepID=A0ABT8JXJ7_9BACL|nr:IucA/IucC family C-terminal-domain containing protein [Sporosarcina highlanderae]MDN4608849.1 IucA/IucC family C-terminal-domain containing protein [Sporosarcina highlanderae]